jgi:hypothetical protein
MNLAPFFMGNRQSCERKQLHHQTMNTEESVMENYDQRRRQAHDDPSRNDPPRPGNESDHRDPGRRNFGDDRQGEPREPRARERGEGRESWRNQQQRDDRPSSFSPDWSQEGAEPRDSDDRYYSRNRDFQQPRFDEPSRGGRPGRWRGDQDRTTTEQQRTRGFEPRDAERGDWFRDTGRGLYGADSPEDDRHRGLDRGRDDEQQSYYRGYYNRSVTPYEYPGGHGNLYLESWTITGPHTGRGPKGYKRSDQQIVEEASLRLERAGQVDATDIEVTAEDGIIRLRGTVPDRASKRRAEECVETIYGARDVMNELRVATAGAGASQSTQSSTPERSSGGASPSAQSAKEDKSLKGSSTKPQH